MSNLVQFPNHSRMREEAATWLSRVDRGLSSAEEAKLQDWLNKNPQHVKAFMRMASLSDQMDVLQELSSLFPLPAAEPTSTRWLGRSAIAATLAAIGIAVGLQLGSSKQEDAPAPMLTASYDTAIGEQRVAELADRSTVLLNTNSSVSVDYSETTRAVHLHKGEAHFSVEKDATRPFEVLAGDKIVRAVGTAFSIEVLPNDVQVTVTEGEVVIIDPATESTANGLVTALREGEKASLVQEAPLVEQLPPERLEIDLAWHRGFIIFQGETLEEALEELSRYSTQQYVIADDSIRAKKIGGYCRTDDVEGFLLSLRDNVGVAANRGPEGQILLTAL